MIFIPLRDDSFRQFVLNLQDYISRNDLIITDDWSIHLAVVYYAHLNSIYLPDIMDKRLDSRTSITNTYPKDGKVYIILKNANVHISEYLMNIDNDFKVSTYYHISPEITGYDYLKKLDIRKNNV
jgi:hypothetical protein